MHISKKGLELICEYEGLELKAYLCPAGIWTIGYGSTGDHVYKGLTITKEEAEQLLKDDLVRFEKGVLKALGAKADSVLQEEFDAMVSLAFNIGVANFTKSSVCRSYKAGNKLAAASAFEMWNKAKVKGKLTVLKGLARRRTAEKQLFLSAKEPETEKPVIRTTTKETVIVPETSIVPSPAVDKPLITSREITGGSIVASYGGLNLLNDISVQDATLIKTTVEEVADKPTNNSLAKQFHIPEIAALLVFVIGVFIIWKRIKDRKKGIR